MLCVLKIKLTFLTPVSNQRDPRVLWTHIKNNARIKTKPVLPVNIFKDPELINDYVKYKVNDPCTLEDIRPISILPCVSKVLKKIVVKEFIRFLEENNILPPV